MVIFHWATLTRSRTHWEPSLLGAESDQLARNSRKLEATKSLKDGLLEAVHSTGLKAKDLEPHYGDLDGFSRLITSAKTAIQALRDYYKSVRSSFDAVEVFEPPKDFESTIVDFRANCEASGNQARESGKKLDTHH
jgi:hypothetical protein